MDGLVREILGENTQVLANRTVDCLRIENYICLLSLYTMERSLQCTSQCQDSYK